MSRTKSLRLILDSCRATLHRVQKRKSTPELLPGYRTTGQSIGESETRFRPASCYPLAEITSSLRDPEVQKGGVGTFQDPWARMRNVVCNYP